MKAILMAGGIGSRISRTINKPKSTLTVGNHTIISHTVDLHLKNGIEVAVVVGYKKEFIFESLKDYDVKYYFNPFYRVTNSAGSLWFARDFMDDDLILANADVYWEQPLLDILLKDGHECVMLGDRSRVDKGDYFFNVRNGFLEDYGKELKRENRNCEYVGFAKIGKNPVAKFKKDLERLVAEEKYNLWWENVLYENLSTTPVYVEDVSDLFWAEVDYIDDYERILNYVKGTGWK